MDSKSLLQDLHVVASKGLQKRVVPPPSHLFRLSVSLPFLGGIVASMVLLFRTLLFTNEPPKLPLWTMAANESGTLAAAIEGDNHVKAVDPRSGNTIQDWNFDGARLVSVAVNDQGDGILAGGFSSRGARFVPRLFYVGRAPRGWEVTAISTPLDSTSASISSTSLSHDGNQWAAGVSNYNGMGLAYIGRVDGHTLQTWKAPWGTCVSGIRFAPGGRQLALSTCVLGMPNGGTRIYLCNHDITITTRHEFRESGNVLDLQFSPDGTSLVLCTDLGEIRIIDVERGETTAAMNTSHDRVDKVGVFGSYIVAACSDEILIHPLTWRVTDRVYLQVWDISQALLQHEFLVHPGCITGMQALPQEGEVLASHMRSPSLHRYQINRHGAE